MLTMFHYNWIVREEWYQWCEDIPYEELIRHRTGGVGSILETLFHIIDMEWSWVRFLEEKPDYQENFEEYNTIDKMRLLDKKFKLEVEEFLNAWDDTMEARPYYNKQADDSIVVETWGGVMRHMIAHEIHHMGQLSVWAREIGKTPVSANVIGKRLIWP
ncbi:MAG: DinB family protein [Candidatus Pristimantibacillus sp.]